MPDWHVFDFWANHDQLVHPLEVNSKRFDRKFLSRMLQKHIGMLKGEFTTF